MPRTSLVIVFILLGLSWNYALYRIVSLPDVTPLKYEAPETSAFMRWDRWSHPWRSVRHRFVPMGRVAPTLQRAVVAAEDAAFFTHPGYDWSAIKRAAQYNWKRRRFARGASTITQQLARNLYLSKAKTPTRKLKEFLIALKLERELGKERILELYLNFAEWGPGIYGCEAAAQHYFRGSCQTLSTAQAAFLAAILPNPNRLGKRGFRAGGRTERILSRM